MWFMIIYMSEILPIKEPWRSISSPLSFINSDTVHGPERCSINSSPPGVTRMLGTENTKATMSVSETMDTVKIMCHWAINQISPWVDDLHRINVIYWATTKTDLNGTLARNHQLRSAWLGQGPRTKCTSFSQQHKRRKHLRSGTVMLQEIAYWYVFRTERRYRHEPSFFYWTPAVCYEITVRPNEMLPIQNLCEKWADTTPLI